MTTHECHTGCDCHESSRTLELDRLRQRVAVLEHRSAATPVDVDMSDEHDATITQAGDVAEQIATGVILFDVEETERGARLVGKKAEILSKLFNGIQQIMKDARENFNACAKLEAENRELLARVDEAMRAGAEIALTLALVRGICNDADDAASDPDCTAPGTLARGRLAREILEVLP